MFRNCKSVKKKLLGVKSLYSDLEKSLDDFKLDYSEGLRALNDALSESIVELHFMVQDLNDEALSYYMMHLRCPTARHFREGRAALKDFKGWYFIDVHGKPINEGRFDEALDFRDGKAKVSRDGVQFYIDRTGKQIGLTL